MVAVKRAEVVEHVEGGLGAGAGVIGARRGDAADEHVGIADGFDFLEPVVFGDAVEGGEQIVEKLDGAVGGVFVDDLGEVHDVGEEHGAFEEAINDGAFALFEAVGDGLGQNVEQEAFGFGAFGAELQEGGLFLVAEAFFLEGGGDAGAEDDGIEGFGDVVFGAGFDAARGAFDSGEGGEHDHG